jgi:hypothetical protein
MPNEFGDGDCFVMLARVPETRKRRHTWFRYVVIFFATLIVTGVLFFFGARAHASERRHHRPDAYACYYVTSNRTGTVGSACYRSRRTCEFQLGIFVKQLGTVMPKERCFVSRETQSFTIEGAYMSVPMVEVLPNRASCVDAYNIHRAAGEEPTPCQPTHARRHR